MRKMKYFLLITGMLALLSACGDSEDKSFSARREQHIQDEKKAEDSKNDTDSESASIQEGTQETAATGSDDFTGTGDVLIDDNELTVLCFGKTMIKSSSLGDVPVYMLRFRNKTSYELDFSFMNVDSRSTDIGTVGSVAIVQMLFSEKTDPAPSSYNLSELSCKLPPNCEKDEYMYLMSGGTGFKTTDELVDVSLNVHTSHYEGSDLQYTDYTLSIDQGQKAPSHQSGYQEIEAHYFSLTIPASWEFDSSDAGDKCGVEHVYLAPELTESSLSGILIQYDNVFTSDDTYNRTLNAYSSEDGYTINSSEVTIDGRRAKMLEITGDLAKIKSRLYFLEMPDGNELCITMCSDLAFLDNVFPEYDRILDSIEFK